MPRPEIKGLKYYPKDTGFYRDKKIRLLRGEHGADGVEVYERILSKCYEDNGYYLIWDADEDYALLADETGYSEEKIRLIVSSCLRRLLFDDTLFKVGNVLTSRGIQRRYFSAIRDTKIKAAAQGRHTTIYKDLCLLTEEDFSELNKTQVWLKVGQNCYLSENNPDKSENNPDKSENNPPKETRGKETRGNKKSGTGADAPAPPPKHKHGEYGWVKITDAEYERLVSEYGREIVEHYIDVVDKKAQLTTNKNGWKDWNLTVRNAIKGRWGGGPPVSSGAKNYNETF